MIADWYDDGRVGKIYPLALLPEGDREAAAGRPRLLEREGGDRSGPRFCKAGQARPRWQGPHSGLDHARPKTTTSTNRKTHTTGSGKPITGSVTEATTGTTDTSGPSSVPVPLLVLGGLAILLLAAGSAGYLHRRMGADDEGDGTPPASA